MNKTITKKRITYAIYGLLFVFFVGIWVWEISKFNEVLSNMWEWDKKYYFPNMLYSFKITNMFSASMLALSFGIGLFFKNRVGWVLITGWFYFVCVNLIRNEIGEKIEDTAMFFQLLVLSVIPVLFIILMNTFDGIWEYHKIQKNNRIRLNLISIGVGLVLVGLLLIKKKMLPQWL
ncbi:hypothetical protein WIW50_12020 [Flavobacteriaceae bacterium 3-367]|uniref:hypothetical protein n=1 Tax=Eudoraea algarum TaxID=3417568 RepID=UPI00328393DF